MQFIVIIILNDNLNSLIKLKSIFYNSVIILNLLFLIELFLVSINILNPSNSLDFREGFRSIFIGFSVEVGFWCMIGTFVALQKIFLEKKNKFIIFLILTIAIQFSTFDRGNLYISLFLVGVYLFKYRKGLFLFFSSVFTVFFTFFLDVLLKSKLFQLKLVLDSAKGIYSDSLFDVIGLNSVIYRFNVQLRYLDRILDNLFLPSGVFTNGIRDNSFINFFFSNDFFSQYNIDFKFESQESHSLFIQLFFELGMLISILLVVYSFIKVKKFRFNFSSKIILIILLLFFSFQSFPRYSFVFITMYGVFLMDKSKSRNSLNSF